MQVAGCDIAATVRQKYNFSVDRFPLAGPENMRTPWYGLFRSDTSEAVGGGSVTDRYTPHTTEDVVALVESASTAFGGTANLRCTFSDGHFVIAEPSKEHRLTVFDNGGGGTDAIWPRLFISAPYGGSGSFQASVGFYRDACRNLARMRMVQGVSVKIRHTHSLRRKMDELIESFSALRGGWENLSDAVMRMEHRRVSMVEFLRAVYPEPDRDEGRAATMHRNRTEAIFRRLTSERMRTGRGDMGTGWEVSAWEAFNAIQGYVQHDSNRRGNPSDIDRVVLAAADPAVLRAEQLALAV
jgi:hypothetical protein